MRTAGVFWPDPRYRRLMQNEEKGPIIIFARFLTKTTVTVRFDETFKQGWLALTLLIYLYLQATFEQRRYLQEMQF